MAMERLTANFVKRVADGRGDPGKYQDGGGLILRVREGGTASWIFRYQRGGDRTEIGLGPLATVSLPMARTLADNQRATLAMGDDPLEERHAVRAKRAAMVSFDEAARAYIEAHEPSWKNPKHRQQWHNTLATYVSPAIGTVPAAKVTTDHVVSILSGIWPTKPETGSRVRGRIEMILDWAKVKGMRSGENPARWRGHLAHMFPAKSKVRAVKNHAAVPVDDLPEVFKRLAGSDGVAAAAVRFCILTAARPGEVTSAILSEVDRKSATWTVPPEKQKRGKAHRVPLSRQALAILDDMDKVRPDDNPHLFPGGRPGCALSLASLSKALRVAGGGEGTVHGTARSTFDDWGSERTSHPHRLIDRALSHGPKDATIAAYRRSELFDQRRPLMDQWARFVTGKGR
jgi:integrase